MFAGLVLTVLCASASCGLNLLDPAGDLFITWSLVIVSVKLIWDGL